MPEPDGWNAWATRLTDELTKAVDLVSQNQVDIRDVIGRLVRLETLVNSSSSVKDEVEAGKDELEAVKRDVHLLKYQAKQVGIMAGTISGIVCSIGVGLIMWLITR